MPGRGCVDVRCSATDLCVSWLRVLVCSMEALPLLDPARSVVMFPSEDALLPEQLPVEQLEHVIIIDAKW